MKTETKSQPEWYSAKTIFKHSVVDGGAQKSVFEERVVLLKATDFREAIEKAEAEAAAYCSASVSAIDLGYVDVYLLSEDAVGEGTEVYSLMRDSKLTDSEYLNQFHDTGNERKGRIQ